MVSLSTFCFMLALARLDIHRTSFNRKFTTHITHPFDPSSSAERFSSLRPRCDILCVHGPAWRRSNPVIDPETFQTAPTMVRRLNDPALSHPKTTLMWRLCDNYSILHHRLLHRRQYYITFRRIIDEETWCVCYCRMYINKFHAYKRRQISRDNNNNNNR